MIPRANGKSLLTENIKFNYEHLIEIAAHVCSKRHGCPVGYCGKTCLNTRCFENFVNSELNWKIIEEYIKEYNEERM